jgi:hypothetical protein
LISVATAAFTAVSGGTTGGNFRTVTNRSTLSCTIYGFHNFDFRAKFTKK